MFVERLIRWIEKRCYYAELLDEDYVEDRFCDESWTTYRLGNLIITIGYFYTPIESSITCDIYNRKRLWKLNLESGDKEWIYPSVKFEKEWKPCLK